MSVDSRDAAADPRLSWAARGVLAYLRHRGIGWNLRTDPLVAARATPDQDVPTLLQELVHEGYLTVDQALAAWR